MSLIKSIITAATLAILLVPFCGAQNNSSSRNSQPITLKKHKTGKTEMPRMPSNQYLEFIYFSDPGECLFTFSYDIETLSVTIVEMNTNCTYLGEVSQDNPIMYQELPAGDYHITCITDEGDIYEGEDHIQ